MPSAGVSVVRTGALEPTPSGTGNDDTGPSVRSSASAVPAAVPSVDHSSMPCSASAAAKYATSPSTATGAPVGGANGTVDESATGAPPAAVSYPYNVVPAANSRCVPAAVSVPG